jgi:hypothetical protein
MYSTGKIRSVPEAFYAIVNILKAEVFFYPHTERTITCVILTLCTYGDNTRSALR